MCIRDSPNAFPIAAVAIIPFNFPTNLPPNEAPAGSASGSIAVSYTHLDVYKRQAST